MASMADALIALMGKAARDNKRIVQFNFNNAGFTKLRKEDIYSRIDQSDGESVIGLPFVVKPNQTEEVLPVYE